MQSNTKKLSALRVEHLKYEPLHSKGSKNAGALLPNRIPDQNGLYLAVLPSGVKSWRYDYRLNGRRVIVYGTYPGITLEKARNLHIDAKRLIAKGEIPLMLKGEISTPAEKRKSTATGDNRFKTVAEEWYEAEQKAGEKSKSWKENYRRWLDWSIEGFGNSKLPDIEASDILASVKKIQDKGYANSAEHLRQTIARVFNYGIRTLRAPKGFNPAEAIRGAIIAPEVRHRSKLDAKELPAFLKAIEGNEREDMRLAVRILLHCFPRKMELGEAKWTEIDFDAALWTIPAERMKKARPHTIPLSTQALGMFRRLKEFAGDSAYVLPSPINPKKPQVRNALNVAIQRMGYTGEQFTPHGARGTAASILADAGWDKEVVKKQLAHDEDDQTDAAYFRNTYLEQRRKMLQSWSDTLDGMAVGAKVFPIGTAKAA